jgi:3-hydroxyacyl-CoA dehydrogenase/enoyl-CoA hydratase/3-hydroxybutyryl-CoA epimerase
MNMESYRSFSVVTDNRGVTTVTLDVPDRPLNILNELVMSELDEIVHNLETRDKCKVVVFRSGKESGFLAGADVRAISQIDSPRQAGQLIDRGQRLFDRIEWLPVPTIAVIHGPCLGGGLEWALSCDYRIARDNSSTKIGFPEIKLGLMPGWGGTQRLPRLVGLTNALTLILQGKNLSALEAEKIGLIHRAIKPEDWDGEVEGIISQLLSGTVIPRRHTAGPLFQRLAEKTRLGRALIFSTAEKKIASKAKHYPALKAAIKAIRASYGLRPEGFLTERDEFIDLLATPTCRNLIEIFFAREMARNPRTWSQARDTLQEDPIRKVGVIGAGAMGAGIGQLAAQHGYDVVLKEVNADAAAAGQTRIDGLIDKLAKHKQMSLQERTTLADRIQVTTDDEHLKDVDLVIEAVVEKADVKQSVFASLDQITGSKTILASNTSSLSIADMAQATARPGLVAGLHFFNPVHKMELVEVVRARSTDDTSIQRLIGFVKSLGKTPVVTADERGFLVNRVLFPYLGEAVWMIAEGQNVEALDKQIRRFGMPMGPLELLDQVGLDVALHVARSLESVLVDVQPVVDQLALMVNDQRLGTKSESGFYRYQKGRRNGAGDFPRTKLTAPSAAAVEDRDDKFVKDGLTLVQRRLIYPLLAESIRCKQQAIVQESWAIDLAMVLGTGFAPHLGGPLHLVDKIGAHIVHANLKQLQSIYGDRFRVPELLDEMAENRLSFFGEAHPATNDHAVTQT